MNTIAFIVLAGIGGFFLLAKLPGLDHLAKPLTDLLTTGIKATVGVAVSWVVYLLKLVWNAHVVIFTHLASRPEDIDPSLRVRGRATDADDTA